MTVPALLIPAAAATGHWLVEAEATGLRGCAEERLPGEDHSVGAAGSAPEESAPC